MTTPTKPTPKKKVRTSLIRYEAIIPFIIVVALIWAYFFFFFDSHVRRALEYVGTQANGAEVNISDVRTSFWNATLDINKIQITDGTEPAKNKIQIGQMKWGMLWDALLRGKVAINEASILEVAIGVPRAKPGYVLPPPPPSKESKFDQLKAAALNAAQKEFDHNVLGDLAAVLGGTDPSEQLKNIQASLKSSEMITKLQAELKVKEAEWKKRLDSLPQTKELEGLRDRVKSVKVDGFSNPAEVQKSLQEIQAIYNDAESKYKNIAETAGALNGDVNNYKTTLAGLETQIKADIADLESRLKIPKLDAASLSKSIFGPLFLNKVRQAEFYMNKAREYMPPKKTAAQKAEFAPPTPREREKGRDYKFGRPRGYPLFWLKHAAISSKAIQGADWSGNLIGELKNVTDDQPMTGLPTIASFKGEFPKQGFYDVLGEITIDHVTEKALEKVKLAVGSFPLVGQQLISSPEVSLGFDAAQVASNFEAVLTGGELTIESMNNFKRPKAENAAAALGFLSAEAKQPILNDILKGALADIPTVSLNARVAGSWTNLQFGINSSLGQDLTRAFDKQIQLKINEARVKLQAFVDERIGKEREKLMAEFNKVKGQIDGVVASKQAELDKAKGQLEQAKNDAIKNQTKGLEKEGKKVLEGLKGKFGF
jgi:uncharacterized protein (TIGR03545 family)